jgi:hypothetical protein
MWNYLIGIFVTKLIASMTSIAKAFVVKFQRTKKRESAVNDFKSAKTDQAKEKAFEELLKASDPNSD